MAASLFVSVEEGANVRVCRDERELHRMHRHACDLEHLLSPALERAHARDVPTAWAWFGV